MTALKAWINSNLFKLTMAAVLVIVVFITLKLEVKGMKPAIATNTQSIKSNSEAVTVVEKDIIGLEASIKAVGVRQEALHDLTDTKLDAIKSAIDKRNDSR